MEVFSQAWSQYVAGSPNFVWEQKLKNTKQELKNWVKTPLPTPTASRVDRVFELAPLQLGMEDNYISSSLLFLENLVQSNASLSFRNEEENLRLKSRCLWLNSGDRNNAYFHCQCKIRLSKNHISEISSEDGVIISGQEQLKQSASKHFQLLYQEDGKSEKEVAAEYLENIPSLVSPEENCVLMKPFYESEIIEFIWAMESDKAPGLDGFFFHFYKVCWHIIKSDLVRMVSAFQREGKVGGYTNSTFLALIPKEVNPSSFDRFHPISLCNVLTRFQLNFQPTGLSFCSKN